jgi:3-deoxy-D-manno-octulosonic-acid transferase
MSPTALIYRFSLKLYHLSIRLAALRTRKARAWIRGRKHVFNLLASRREELSGCVWFHCASLGEFEQGRPIIEALRTERPGIPILVTFFSPSGYEVRKHYSGATLVTYLPASSSRNARHFLRLVNPSVAVFVKYEFWYHYLVALRRLQVPLIIASANFRTKHWLFKRYASFIANELKAVRSIYAQNPESWKRLSDAGFTNAVLATDTRFDRVMATVAAEEGDALVDQFTRGRFTLIAGSTWPDDERLLAEIDVPHSMRLIIAPHEVTRNNILRLRKLFDARTVLYSDGPEAYLQARIMIIDNVGILAKVYRYGSVAYVGGGFSGRLHNVLEPAAFGLPVIFGPKFSGFPEAVELIGIGVGYTVKDSQELKRLVDRFATNASALQAVAREARQFVASSSGGTAPVVEDILSCLERNQA